MPRRSTPPRPPTATTASSPSGDHGGRSVLDRAHGAREAVPQRPRVRAQPRVALRPVPAVPGAERPVGLTRRRGAARLRLRAGERPDRLRALYRRPAHHRVRRVGHGAGSGPGAAGSAPRGPRTRRARPRQRRHRADPARGRVGGLPAEPRRAPSHERARGDPARAAPGAARRRPRADHGLQPRQPVVPPLHGVREDGRGRRLPRPRRARGLPPQHRWPGVPDLAQLPAGRVGRALRGRRLRGRVRRRVPLQERAARARAVVGEGDSRRAAARRAPRLPARARVRLRGAADARRLPCRHRGHVPPAQALTGTVRTILVVYGLMQYPLRSTVEDHLYSFRRYSKARVFYANALVGPVPGWMRRIPFDAIVFHTSFLSSLRWGPRVDETLRARALELDGVSGVRAAMPQDEFLRSGALCDFIRDARVDVVFSVSPASEWPKIYAGVDRERVRFEPTLTGYLDERTLTRIDEIVRQTGTRPVDVFYRAGAERPYLGRHGMLKTRIATAGAAEATARGMTTDISLDPGATLLGDAWFGALARSRWTLGVEGGASILDPDGAIRAATMRYAAEHPNATYDEIEAACFPGRDGELALFAISPRHLEACATRTGQILVEGAYSDVLEPGRHYLSV